MTTTLNPGSTATSSPLGDILSGLGFSRRGRVWRRGALSFERIGEWLLLTAPAPKRDDARCGVDRPGLWKEGRKGTKRVLAFPLPASILHEDEGADPDEDGLPECGRARMPFEACLLWALAGLAGDAPDGWHPPGEEALASWTEQGDLTVQHGAVVRQIEVIREERRFALRVVLAGEIAAGLPDRRRQWVHALLHDVESSWRLVRTVITAEHGAIAEVDLTGLPAEVGPHVFRAALASLRWVVAGLAETMEFIGQADAPSEALELCPPSRRSSTK